MEVELHLFDSDMGRLEMGTGSQASPPGKAVALDLSPPPNTTFFFQVSGAHNTSGEYTVTVRPLKAFDAFEPNDDIFSASKIALGQAVNANIMDVDDTDFYSFESPRTGTVTIDIRPRSTTLLPALTTFSSDRRNTGFGPDVELPGSSLHHTIEVQEHLTYFLQVWSQHKSAGEYSLIVQ